MAASAGRGGAKQWRKLPIATERYDVDYEQEFYNAVTVREDLKAKLGAVQREYAATLDHHPKPTHPPTHPKPTHPPIHPPAHHYIVDDVAAVLGLTLQLRAATLLTVERCMRWRRNVVDRETIK